MKILHLTPQLEPEVGGIGAVASRLIRELSARGHQQAAIVSEGLLDLPSEAEEDGAAVHRMPFFAALETRDAGSLLRCKLRASKIKRTFAPDVVHLHIGGPTAFMHLATANDAPAPLVVTVYDLPPDTTTSPTLLSVLGSARRIVAISDVRFEDLRRDVPAAIDRCVRIYPSIVSADVDPPVARSASPLLMMGGRHVTEKGLHVGLQAFATVASRHNDARLVVTGDGLCHETLVELATQLGLRDRVTFTGRIPVSEVRAWRQRAWIVLVPTLTTESFGLVALEAMHAGAVVIGSQIEGLRELVVDGETGRLVPPNDPAAIAAAVEELLSDPARRQQIGDAAKARAVTAFNATAFADSYERVFMEAVG